MQNLEAACESRSLAEATGRTITGYQGLPLVNNLEALEHTGLKARLSEHLRTAT
jgi:hypothetical protein